MLSPPLAATPTPFLLPAKSKSPLAAAPAAQQHPLLPYLPQCTTLRALAQLHAAAVKSGLQAHPAFVTRLLTLCTDQGAAKPAQLSYARQVFDRIPGPGDVVWYNTLLRGYARCSAAGGARPPAEEAARVFVRMLEEGVAPDTYTFVSLLKACAAARAGEEGRQAHGVAVKVGAAEHEYVLPTLINMYAECGDARAARTMFGRVDGECVVSYNAMITAAVRSSRPGEALVLFREMQAKGLKLTSVTLISVLSACALLGALELGRWIHEYVRKVQLDSLVKVNTALIDMYGKCGSLEDAISVFQGMESRDRQAWSVMIVAYANHSYGREAISLFEEMKKQGIKPDDVTFLGVLYACSHSGLVSEGLQYFDSMREFGLVPGIKHYGCVADLLARSGQLDRAYEFIDELPIKPTAILWRTLLSACGSRGDADLGKQVFERILELDDSHGGDYVIFSNLCANTGRWEEMNRVRKLMNEKGVVKVPGCSSIEVDNRVHEFFAGDGRHPKSLDARRMVDGVIEQLKLAGYVPNTSHVFHVEMGEEEKAVSLRYHSEKLAISFGLLNTSPGTTLRVVKNLRVCPDCHSMAKLVSMVFNRRIILRDLNRFHHFEDGVCSCGDYW
ncbi:pentatricopeptide repeat-containing protein At2g02980, chloroplastic [Brachypodium distachyon]|uniref:DYW domain-containing protein n=1 Tax=Brachypodium distachyon TaxID=15368 RepID=I1GM91_BRADI|nr:pentatricopeptide repeat-containing protein At2g02980, chloroplastic [Brachypodium distachyon]XP_024312845.1 pentatricopeptide repeat-containing protein At2g02980, chloroplastic [Brachypodium distachyon]XP_024312846.1 pentatricopeptide repeat-containing protein At2g02980, chloroplastic [Brachypodium distachyon]XP_024312847.1 pentatricopeptide repeat-containing protein At2g02980, chloroplastic [Brachypodium distachyon]XP_024312848.1 pentatricopeptide repeat-containing protein At2g02980, chlor|eukprot:XP_003557509.1 pentatricopeptide repeat-containing protein At2g02980, chloroplastic [Brachypodium distachyon]